LRIYFFIFFDAASPLKTITKRRLESLLVLNRGKAIMKIECKNFINNELTNGSGEKLSVISPSTGKIIGDFNCSTKVDLDHAVNHALVAQKTWEETPIKERSKVMFNFRNILLRDMESIASVTASESGKTMAEARAEILKGIEVLEYATSIQNLDLGGKIEVSRGVFCEYRRIALGVVANITPFNFPAMVPMWTIPIVLTLGNAYIWKPSDKTPLTSNIIARGLKEAGLPAGLFQVVLGQQATVEAILDHEKIKAVGFVGSTKVAQIVYERGSKNGKRVLALGGAKNHIILLPDANIELTGAGISDSFTGCAGQRCMAASVLLAVGDVTSHIEKIVERAKSLQLGSDMGAIITRSQVDFLSAAIARAEAAGAKILLDGRLAKVPADFADGHWIGPTILDNVDPKSEAATMELFGPIISIVRCKSIHEAMEIENANPYGNACSVFTTNGALAERIIQSARAGMIGVNVGVPVPREPFSFGGINASKFGHGDITGVHSLNFWTDIKKITTKWEKQHDHTWMS
jgi:malonate-semialdehyde dehydrogenase (acetylating)/methylmalonate-semialdehyde dehydrogenase